MKITLKVIVLSFSLFIIATLTVLTNLNNFPIPTGAYGVGKTTTYLEDTTRVEINSPTAAKRELEIIIWYPVDKKIIKPCCLYDGGALESAKEFMSSLSGVPCILFTGINFTKTFTQNNSPISQKQDRYPAIILPCPPGPMVQNYSWIAEELASQGYIVLGINHPYLSSRTRLPGNRIIGGLYGEKSKEGKESIKKWKAVMDTEAIADLYFVINKLLSQEQNVPNLFDKIDTQRIGLCAHSRAGAWVINVCREDPRIKAGVIMDSIPRGEHATEGVSTPLMILLAENSRVRKGKEGEQDAKALQQFIDASAQAISLVSLPSVGHSTFTDIPLLLRETPFTYCITPFINVDLDTSVPVALNALQISKQKIVDFFGKHLK